MTIQFQRLLTVVRATEEEAAGGVRMDIIYDRKSYPECGTAGCLIGNYNCYVGRDTHLFGLYIGDHCHFGITEREYRWLFSDRPSCINELSFSTPEFVDRMRRNLARVTKQQALSRLRKFIYYKLHKHELCYDEKYGVRDEARRKEGDHGFAAMALAEATA